jgi:hypothetical protein
MSHPVYRVRTRFPRFANRANIRMNVISLSLRTMIGLTEIPTPLFTAPLLHTPTAFPPEPNINPSTTHWPPPELLSQTPAVAIPLQGKDTAIPLHNPMIPQDTRRRVLAGSRAVPSDQSDVVHGHPLRWLMHPHARGTASATTRMKRPGQAPGYLRVYFPALGDHGSPY